MRTPHWEVYKVAYDMLKLTGCWPQKNSGILYKLWGVSVYNTSVILSFVMFSQAYKCRNDFAKLSEILFITIMVTTYLFKHGSIFYYKRTFFKMMELLEHPILTSYPVHLDVLMKKRARFSQFVSNLYRAVVSINVTLIGLSPFIDKTPLPFSYEVKSLYLFQVVAIAGNAWNNCAMDCLVLSLTGIAVTQLEILGQRIVSISKNKNEYQRDQEVVLEVKRCIEHHLMIIEYIQLIDKILSFAILSQFLASVLIICNALFHFVLITIGSSQFFMLLSFIAVSVWQLFIYCWFGNEIIWKSLSICDSCFVFDWYNHGNDVRKLLFLIMERSKRPLSISAFKFARVSLRTFMSVIQWSYSYFTLMIKLYNKRSAP